jgi:hypothetical protein
MPRGPETTLNEETIAKICHHLRRHGFRETAIACAGVNKCTVRDWIRYGVRDQRAGVDSIFRELADRMDAAELEAEAELIGGIQERGLTPFLKSSSTSDKGSSESYEAPDWKALAWIAERRGAKRWGIKKHLTVALDQDRAKLLKVAEKALEPDAFNKLLSALAAAEDADDDSAGDAGEEDGGE